MAYRLQFDARLSDERRRIALEQIDRCLLELNDESLDVHQRVHQFRKRAKKIRALARLFRPADEAWYQRTNRSFRDLAREYADLRDAAAAVGTFDLVLGRYDRQINVEEFLPVRGLLLRERTRLAWEETQGERLPALQEALRELRGEVRQWPDTKLGTDVIVAGFAITYRRARRATRKALESADEAVWHEWRKRVKYQRHQWALLRALWPPLIALWQDELHRLSDAIGNDHDLVELRVLLTSRIPTDGVVPRTLEALLGLMRQHSIALRADALPMGKRLFADRTSAVEHRLGTWFATL